MMHNEQHKTPVSAPVDSFQGRVQPWMMACFGAEISADGAERNHRLLEESLELVQACGCTASEAHQLVEYVYGRPVGERAQEVGGVMVTLAALCLAQGLDMHAAGETELTRIWTKVEAIRAKQAAKPKHSPLPAAAHQVVADDGLVPLSVDGKSVWLEGIGAVALDYSSVKSLSDIQDAAAPAQGDAAITDTSLVDLCEFMNAASISNIPILLSAQSAGALVKAMTTSAPAQAHHSDDIAVDRCATAMKHKLAVSRAKGRGGWDDPEQCSIASLSELLRVHVDKGDPLDVANIAMMIQQRGGSISAPVQAQEPVAYIWSVNGMVKTGGDSIFDDREKFYSAPVQPVAVPDGPSAEDYSDMLRDFFFRYAAGGYNDEGGLVPLETAKDKLEWIVNEAIQHAAPAAQGDAVKLECCGSTEFCERAACPAQGDAKELTDDEIVQAVRSVGVDTHRSKFGFIDEQIEGMSVTVLRQVIAAIAAKAAS